MKKNPMTFNEENLRRWLYLNVGRSKSSNDILDKMGEFFDIKFNNFDIGIEWSWRIIYDRLQVLKLSYNSIFNSKTKSNKNKQNEWKAVVSNFNISLFYVSLKRVSKYKLI